MCVAGGRCVTAYSPLVVVLEDEICTGGAILSRYRRYESTSDLSPDATLEKLVVLFSTTSPSSLLEEGGPPLRGELIAGSGTTDEREVVVGIPPPSWVNECV